MRTSILRLAAVATTAGAISLLSVGCGSEPTQTQATPGGHGRDAVVSGSGPVDTLISLDARALADRDTTTRYRDRALAAAETTITHGGQLRVTVFGAKADEAVTAYEIELPTLAEADVIQRAEDEATARDGLAANLDATLGLSDAAPEVAARVRASADDGADVARAVRAAVRQALPVVRSDGERRPRAGAEDRETVVLILTPGLNDTAELDLAKHLSDPVDEIAKRLRKLTGPADGLAVLQLSGVGVGAGLDSEQTDQLVRAWRRALKQTGARSVPVSSEI